MTIKVNAGGRGNVGILPSRSSVSCPAELSRGIRRLLEITRAIAALKGEEVAVQWFESQVTAAERNAANI